MVEPRNCKRCGKLFLSAGVAECPSCLEADEETFDRVRLYLIEHPGAGLEQVARETGVPAEAILRYLREGRLQASSRSSRDGAPSGGPPDRSGFHTADLFRRRPPF